VAPRYVVDPRSGNHLVKKREISIKPSCMSEIHAFPAGQATQLWEKINYLVDDPIPDGKLKKKLKAKRDIYRLRVGNYRVIYTFGDAWVRLLGIRLRNAKTYDGFEADAPSVPLADQTEEDLDDLLIESPENPVFSFNLAGPSNPLPRRITVEWL